MHTYYHTCIHIPSNIQTSVIYLHICFLISSLYTVPYLGEIYQPTQLSESSYLESSEQHTCYELNNVPQNRYAEDLFPSIPECECI